MSLKSILSSEKVTINLNVLTPPMKYQISCNITGRLVVTLKFHWVISTNFSSLSNCLIQASSHVATTIAQYSAYAVDQATTLCFLLFQDSKLPPTRSQYPNVECLLEGDLVQHHQYIQWSTHSTSYQGWSFVSSFDVCGYWRWGWAHHVLDQHVFFYIHVT